MRNRAFVVEYADARARWRDGAAAVFPPGTYWLPRFASVPVAGRSLAATLSLPQHGIAAAFSHDYACTVGRLL
jgi:hypothetical protein